MKLQDSALWCVINVVVVFIQTVVDTTDATISEDNKNFIAELRMLLQILLIVRGRFWTETFDDRQNYWCILGNNGNVIYEGNWATNGH